MTSRESKEALMGCTLAALGLPVWMFLMALVKAYVARWMWIWFVTPTFDIKAPGFAMVYGLTLFIGALWPDRSPPKETNEHSWWLTPLVGYPLLLLMGYITHWLVVR